MKIKRKEYEKQLKDKYWEGVKAGINFALEHPQTAEQYRNNVAGMRIIVDKGIAAINTLTKSLSKVF